MGHEKNVVLGSSYIHGKELTGATVILNLLRFLGLSGIHRIQRDSQFSLETIKDNKLLD